MNRLDKFIYNLDRYSDLVVKLFVFTTACFCFLLLVGFFFGFIGVVAYTLYLQGAV